MTTREFIQILEAYDKGKPVQQKLRGFDNWSDFDGKWNTVSYTYRIKPEEEKPGYIPYQSAEEVLEDMRMRGVFVKGDCESYSGFYAIDMLNNESMDVVSIGRADYDWWLKHFTWTDGTPFGKKIGEGKQ